MSLTRTSASTPERNRRGYSLIELMTVTVIVALMTSLSVMAYRAYTHRHLAPEGARRLKATLTAAREHAIANNRLYQTVIDQVEGKAWVDCDQPGSPDYQNMVTTPIFMPDSVSFERIDLNGSQQTNRFVRISFTPDGMAVGDVNIDLIENQQIDKLVRLRVYRTTGRVSVREIFTPQVKQNPDTGTGPVF